MQIQMPIIDHTYRLRENAIEGREGLVIPERAVHERENLRWGRRESRAMAAMAREAA